MSQKYTLDDGIAKAYTQMISEITKKDFAKEYHNMSPEQTKEFDSMDASRKERASDIQTAQTLLKNHSSDNKFPKDLVSKIKTILDKHSD